jgi:hypothetical protein
MTKESAGTTDLVTLQIDENQESKSQEQSEIAYRQALYEWDRHAKENKTNGP